MEIESVIRALYMRAFEALIKSLEYFITCDKAAWLGCGEVGLLVPPRPSSCAIG
jgi:hypothetical protein